MLIDFSCCLPKSKAEQVMNRGEEMMTHEFNVLKIVKNLRDIKIHLKARGIMTKISKIKAANSGGNVIV